MIYRQLFYLITILASIAGAENRGSLIFTGVQLFKDDEYLKTGTQTVDISLSEQPTGNVSVTIDPEQGTSSEAGKFFAVSPCNLVFTEADWDKPQTITIRALPITLGTQEEGSRTLDFKVNAKYRHWDVTARGNDGTYCKQTINPLRVNRIFKREKMCFSTGDPHFMSFDGEVFDFYGEDNGIYYLMKTAETTIIAQHYRCAFPPYCNLAVAVRHFNHTFRVEIDRSKTTANEMLVVGNPVDDSLIKVKRTDNNFEVTLTDKTKIVIGAYFWHNPDPKGYINIVITASGVYHSRTGEYLCGNFDGVVDTRIAGVYRNPTIDQNPPVVAAADNYFSCPAGGCALSPRTSIDTCTPTALPADFCGTGPMPEPQKAGDQVVEEQVYSDNSGSSETLSASEGFTDDASTVSGSSSSRTSRGSYTRSRTSYVLPSSSSSVSSEPSIIFDSVSSEEPAAEALIHQSVNPYADSCFEMTPKPILVKELDVADTIQTYCESVFTSHPALGCVQHQSITDCNDAAIMGFVGIENVVSFAQDIMNSVRLNCAIHIQNLLSGEFDSNRLEGERLSKVYDIEFTHINCSDGKILPKAVTLSNKVRTTISASGTNIVVEDVCADGSCIIADSSNQSTAGIGIAAAVGGVAAVGLIVGLVIMTRRKLSSDSIDTFKEEPKPTLRENPLYASAHGSNDSLAQTARGKGASGPRRSSNRANRRISDIA